jgi:hypothetical protein
MGHGNDKDLLVFYEIIKIHAEPCREIQQNYYFVFKFVENVKVFSTL